MRPLRLEMRGLRSYRSQHEIDFSNAGLIAIVGDTGAGKSSILEAITYALYNGTTWDQRGVKQLISDGSQTVAVTLDFSVDGHNYRVTRSTSRTQYPPSAHKLESLSDPDMPRFDGEASVNAEIERLVGLDWKSFRSSVVLPQGRFQMLLQATPGDRTAILKGIFRLDELVAVRENADELARRLRPRLDELRWARAQLLLDPFESAREAGQRKKDAATREKAFRNARDDVRKADEEARKADAAADELGALEAGLGRHQTGGAKEYGSLVLVASGIDAERQTLEEEARRTGEAESTLVLQIRNWDDRGEGAETLVRADESLARIESSLVGIQEETIRLRNEEARIAAAERETLQEAETVKQLRRQADEAETAVAASEEQISELAERLAAARDRLRIYRVAAEAQEGQERLVAELARRILDLDETLQTVRAASDQALRDRDEASRILESVRRAHSAAHAAEGTTVGDPCPICARPIQSGFVPPHAPEDRDASLAMDKAEGSLQKAREALTIAEAELRQTREGLASAQSDRSSRSEDTSRARAGFLEVVPDADLSNEDVDVLRHLVDQNEEMVAKRNELRREAKALRTAADRADAKIEPRRLSLERDRYEFDRASASLRRESLRCEADRLTIPERFRPEATLTADAIKSSREDLRRELAALRELEQHLSGVRAAINDLRDRTSALNQKERDAVEAPRQRLQKRFALLHQDAARVARELSQASLLSQSDGMPLVEEATWAEEIERRVDALAEHLKLGVEQARQRAIESRGVVRDTLLRVDVPTSHALEEGLIAAASDAKQAQADLDRARNHEPKAAELDRRIDQGHRFVASLDELAGLLTDGQFIRHVVSRKQRALLALASDIVGSMTGARYGFSEDFQVVDLLSGQPRSAKTLSGGETFMASLALALALVELAGRSGGRLEAIFLDEGFGSLDANSLDEALGELERRASTGRLVGVVSHLRAVAERIETVLNVTNTPTGSVARWITGPDRESLVGEELEEGLLA